MALVATERTREILGGVSPQTLYNYRKRKDFPKAKSLHFGRRIFFDEEELQEWFNSNLIKTKCKD